MERELERDLRRREGRGCACLRNPEARVLVTRFDKGRDRVMRLSRGAWLLRLWGRGVRVWVSRIDLDKDMLGKGFVFRIGGGAGASAIL